MEINNKWDLLLNALKNIGCSDIDRKISQFDTYMKGILYWNEKVNLTAIKDPDLFVRDHYLDSLLPVLSSTGVLCGDNGHDIFSDVNNVVDVGTGGGFPGVPLAIVFPEIEFVLIDSLKKRLRIVKDLCEDAGIENVGVAHMRAEDAGRSEIFRENFDVCVSRAVANMSVLCEYCLPLVRNGGTFLSYKGSSFKSELEMASNAIDLLGGKYFGCISSSDVDDGRTIIMVKKINHTNPKYPRRGVKIAKNPL